MRVTQYDDTRVTQCDDTSCEVVQVADFQLQLTLFLIDNVAKLTEKVVMCNLLQIKFKVIVRRRMKQ